MFGCCFPSETSILWFCFWEWACKYVYSGNIGIWNNPLNIQGIESDNLVMRVSFLTFYGIIFNLQSLNFFFLRSQYFSYINPSIFLNSQLVCHHTSEWRTLNMNPMYVDKHFDKKALSALSELWNWFFSKISPNCSNSNFKVQKWDSPTHLRIIMPWELFVSGIE